MVLKMSNYVRDVEHAVDNLLTGIQYGHDRLTELELDLKKLLSYQSEMRRTFRNVTSDPFDDDDGIGTLAYWEGYFTGSKITDIEDLIVLKKQEIADRQFAIAALCGARLQIGKQGISVSIQVLLNVRMAERLVQFTKSS